MKHEFKTEFDKFEQIYLCKYYEKIPTYELAMGLNTRAKLIRETMKKLKEQGLYEKYKNMEDIEWLKT